MKSWSYKCLYYKVILIEQVKKFSSKGFKIHILWFYVQLVRVTSFKSDQVVNKGGMKNSVDDSVSQSAGTQGVDE